ncbi:ATPase AAA, partial [Bifidobacterium pseudolongum subsp. globosum]
SRLLFQIISDSYETRSIIYTTNIEFSGWGRIPGDANMAAALIDRTVHHGRLIRFQGESYRSQHALMTKYPSHGPMPTTPPNNTATSAEN